MIRCVVYAYINGLTGISRVLLISPAADTSIKSDLPGDGWRSEVAKIVSDRNLNKSHTHFPEFSACCKC